MTRVLSGVVLGAAFFTIVWFGTTLALLGVTMAVCALACHEYAGLMAKIDAEPPRLLTQVATMATVALASRALVLGTTPPLAAPFALTTVAMALVAMVGLRPSAGTSGEIDPAGFRRAVASAAAGIFSILYLGLPLGYLVSVHWFAGRRGVLLLIATVVVSDTAQYYAGRNFGRRPLAPRLSPKKTIEGALGGLLVAPAFLAMAAPSVFPGAMPLPFAALGVAIVILGIAGDLFESMLKRAAAVKDSSALIPGHGGVLDRIDALLFASPLYYMVLVMIVPPSGGAGAP